MSASARWLTLVALLLVPLATGCSTLLTVAYLVQPADVPAEFAELKGKKVAVVCRPIIELEFTDAGSARELASLVGLQIEQNVRRSDVVGQHEVARWIDENAWVDYQTVGKALESDYVVGIDLEEFRFHEGSTLYRGRATAHVKVYDLEEKKLVFQKRIDDFAFPANNAIPAADRSEAEFRSLFLQMLSQRISRLFHAYESREVFAEDSLTF
ncbi:MAG: hypothetical protein O3C39_01935 [Planctomycetota bacterium]|jgi:hypothetical protein|nr:hypothetical protein [Pirellulales bacterium]MDA0254173.1 hypothetical protein [Planctomycetota bacterium]MDA1200422.1 hypothetical protein [Planctomycetota bacterium]